MDVKSQVALLQSRGLEINDILTRIGKIENLSQTELKEFLNAGRGSVEVTLAEE
ncbi:MAG: hypothetical protein IKR60_02280 [Alphaproteobacteria bacterium]|nr:hypothetical protein [Alphaproteobacteria bacterium]